MSQFVRSLGNAGKITLGLFLTDHGRSVAGRVWQLLSRFTWEFPQTFVGWLFTFLRALVGKTELVKTFGGITYAIGPSKDYGKGVSLGTFIDVWATDWMREEREGRITDSHLLRHEFGHTFDSQRFGPIYLLVIGLPSLVSALGKGEHELFWTEVRANSHARRYFTKH